MSDLHKKAMLSNKPLLPGLPPRIPVANLSSLHQHHQPGQPDSARKSSKAKRDYTLIPWSNYYDRFEEISTPNGTFRVYVKGDSGPAFFFLHGGGFSGLTWSLLSSSLAGKIKCQCFSMDIRGHGSTTTNNDEDLCIETLTKDVSDVIKGLWKDEPPKILLVGHSMGGAIAIHAAATADIPSLIGLVVIDVVEGSALEALSSMQTFLQSRPKIFNSIEQAIEYHVRMGAIRNVESARVSVIGQLKKLDKSDVFKMPDDLPNLSDNSHAVMQTEIEEEDEDGEQKADKEPEKRPESAKSSASAAATGDKYEWRIDLTKTEKFWKDWFKGLSALFLNVHVPRLLLLAGVDRLDKELMVGQMQGKFQVQILPLCGHAVHEDAPEDVADALANFMLRYKFVEPVGPISPPNISC